MFDRLRNFRDSFRRASLAQKSVADYRISSRDGIIDFSFYVKESGREKMQMVSVQIGKGKCVLTLEGFWRQLTEMMDWAASRDPGRLPGVYNCDGCHEEFKYSSRTGKSPNFCPLCGHMADEVSARAN